MNVLILTPDAVGSTLLQRVLTITMQFHDFGRPVINLHELTNGLNKFYSPDFNQEILNKQNAKWGYHQSLEEVVSLLDSVTHWKTARLAQYHIHGRQDSMAQQIPFYNYLNENFFIIACRRKNVFEHGLSWAITTMTKKLNVYSSDEKLETFLDLYKTGITVDVDNFLLTLRRYKSYLDWCEQHFQVGSYFWYERDVPNIERFILNLPLFAGQQKLLGWKDSMDIDFSTWNKCHFAGSDIGSVALDDREKFLAIGFDRTRTSDLEKYRSQGFLPEVLRALPPATVDFVNQNGDRFKKANQSIARMVELGIIMSSPPIKKQTTLEKLYLIKNIDQLIEVYNSWAGDHADFAEPVSKEQLFEQGRAERAIYSITGPTTTLPVLPPT